MFATTGDRLVVHSKHLGGPVRDAEVLEVRHPDGSPPYLVRWSDNGQEGLVPRPRCRDPALRSRLGIVTGTQGRGRSGGHAPRRVRATHSRARSRRGMP